MERPARKTTLARIRRPNRQPACARSGYDFLQPGQTRERQNSIAGLGAEEDGSYSHDDVRRTAHAYHTEAELFPSMGHDMMLEPEWAAVAERIHRWLGMRGL